MRRDWVGSQGFPYKAKRCCLLGSGNVAKAPVEDSDRSVLGLLTDGSQGS